MIQCNSMDAACIDFSRPELPPTLKGSPAHLATVEIRLALGWTVCEGHCLWNALIRCGHLLKMSESQKPQAASCLLSVQFTGFRGFHTCLCLSAFYNEDPFQPGLFWSNLAKFSYVLLACELRFCVRCSAPSVSSSHFNLGWGSRLWNPPGLHLLKQDGDRWGRHTAMPGMKLKGVNAP